MSGSALAAGPRALARRHISGGVFVWIFRRFSPNDFCSLFRLLEVSLTRKDRGAIFTCVSQPGDDESKKFRLQS